MHKIKWDIANRYRIVIGMGLFVLVKIIMSIYLTNAYPKIVLIIFLLTLVILIILMIISGIYPK